ncbi:MAG: hypothetical protein ACLRVB_02770 [Blautia sp.]
MAKGNPGARAGPLAGRLEGMDLHRAKARDEVLPKGRRSAWRKGIQE